MAFRHISIRYDQLIEAFRLYRDPNTSLEDILKRYGLSRFTFYRFYNQWFNDHSPRRVGVQVAKIRESLLSAGIEIDKLSRDEKMKIIDQHRSGHVTLHLCRALRVFPGDYSSHVKSLQSQGAMA